MVLLQVPTGWRFLMSKVPLYIIGTRWGAFMATVLEGMPDGFSSFRTERFPERKRDNEQPYRGTLLVRKRHPPRALSVVLL